MSKVDRLQEIKETIEEYERAREYVGQLYLGLLDVLNDNYDNCPRGERPTQAEIASVTTVSRGRIAQLLVKARRPA